MSYGPDNYIPGPKVQPAPRLHELMTWVLCEFIPFEETHTIEQATKQYFTRHQLVVNAVPRGLNS